MPPRQLPRPDAARRGENVLYVDDEEQLVDLVTRMMERMGYDITGMTEPSEAIEAVRANPAARSIWSCPIWACPA